MTRLDPENWVFSCWNLLQCWMICQKTKIHPRTVVKRDNLGFLCHAWNKTDITVPTSSEPELWGAKNIRQVVEKRRAHQNPLFAESTEWLDFTKRRSSPMDPTNPGGKQWKMMKHAFWWRNHRCFPWVMSHVTCHMFLKVWVNLLFHLNKPLELVNSE